MMESVVTPVAVPALITIPAGWFLMGCESGQDNERPIHRVWVDAYRLAATQVTNAEYAVFLRDVSPRDGRTPPEFSNPDFSHPRQPVVAVSWFDAVTYCEWLSARSAHRFRLPTEAEWERAARGHLEGALYPWGDEPPQSLPGYGSRWLRGPESVGAGQPNGFGLFEMCENVHEWCSDWYGAGYYADSPPRNPAGPESGTRRSSRGGSWRHHIKVARCAARSSIPPEFHYADYGFRVACGT